MGNNSEKMIGSLLVGAAIGAVLGVLLAPQKGSKTRKQIIGKKDELTSSLKEKFNSFLGEAKKEFEAEKEKLKEFAASNKGK